MGRYGEVQCLVGKRLPSIQAPRGRGFDRDCAQRLRRLFGQTTVDQDKFHGNGFWIAVSVSNRDLNSAAAIQINHAAKILVCLHGQWAPVRGVDIERVGAAVRLTRSYGWVQIGCLEEPIDAVEWNHQWVCHAVALEQAVSHRRCWCYQLCKLCFRGPQDNAGINVPRVSKQTLGRVLEWLVPPVAIFGGLLSTGLPAPIATFGCLLAFWSRRQIHQREAVTRVMTGWNTKTNRPVCVGKILDQAACRKSDCQYQKQHTARCGLR